MNKTCYNCANYHCPLQGTFERSCTGYIKTCDIKYSDSSKTEIDKYCPHCGYRLDGIWDDNE